MIKQAKFVVSVADASKVPDYGACEIAIAGKSNVGKSSFINFMVNQNKLAKLRKIRDVRACSIILK